MEGGGNAWFGDGFGEQPPTPPHDTGGKRPAWSNDYTEESKHGFDELHRSASLTRLAVV